MTRKRNLSERLCSKAFAEGFWSGLTASGNLCPHLDAGAVAMNTTAATSKAWNRVGKHLHEAMAKQQQPVGPIVDFGHTRSKTAHGRRERTRVVAN